MSGAANTVFLRLEGALQAWGDNSKFVIRRTTEAPTKSGVIGLICCAMGLSRQGARERFPELNTLAMGVRIDLPGTRWWDYHTVGAGYGILTAQGIIKKTASTREYETLVSRREYLCDASFLVALRGDSELIKEVAGKLKTPKWPLYLGRKCCPPAVPILVMRKCKGEWKPLTECHDNIESSLTSKTVPWRPRLAGDKPKGEKIGLRCLIEWQPRNGEIAPADAEVWYDAPVSFDPPVHEPRLVQRTRIEVQVDDNPIHKRTPPPARPRANYSSHKWTDVIRPERLTLDQGLCVFCKSPATTVQHITYRRAGGGESDDDLRSLCRLCHDAVTMIEYGLGMGLDRINPEEPRWRDKITSKRQEIIEFRSLETRRRRLQPEEVE
jgi:CRISPR system Cascade subunit CasD